MTETQPTRIRVLGMGNVLMGDDGFGPAVIHTLERGWEWPADVEVLDVGTPGLNLTPFLTGSPYILLVDVAEHDGAVGDVRMFSRPEVLRLPAPQRVNPHDPGLCEALMALEFAEQGPRDFRLVAARPERVERGPGLSEKIQLAIAGATQEVLAVLAEWGAHPVARAMPSTDPPWWLKP